jgi:hypothetical protein
MVLRERVKKERRASWLDRGPGASRWLPPQLSAASRRDLDGFRGHYRVRDYDRLEIDIG